MKNQGQYRCPAGWGSPLMQVWGSVCALVLIAGMVTAPVLADDEEKDHGPNPAARLEKLSKKLGLTEAQQEKIRPILVEKAKEIQALHLQMRTLRQQAMAQIEAELTDEQKAKFQGMREQYKEKKHKRQGKHGKKNDRQSEEHH